MILRKISEDSESYVNGMGHDKLRKFAENETFKCLVQPSSKELLSYGFLNLKDHPLKGKWAGFFGSLSGKKPDPSRPVVLELGCGKGEYTIDLAQRNPDSDYIGVDIKGARLWTGAKYATQNSLPNVAFLRTRIEFITSFFAPGEVSEIWLTFSDPQMKSENSRLTSPGFLERYRSFLKPGGVVHLKTDSRFLHEYTRYVCEANRLRVLSCTTNLYGAASAGTALRDRATLGDVRGGTGTVGPERSGGIPEGSSRRSAGIEPEVYEVQTFYEKMFLAQGCPITYMSFVIDHKGDFVHPETFDASYWRDIEGSRRSFGHVPGAEAAALKKGKQ